MYSGPFLIVSVLGPVNVRIQATKRSRPFVVHIDKLKSCFGPTPVSWLVPGEVEAAEQRPEVGEVDDHFLLSLAEAEEVTNASAGERCEPPSLGDELVSEVSRPIVRPRRKVRRPRRLQDYQ